MRRKAFIISYSNVQRDARVLRQIKYLSPYYDLTVIGYGPPHPDWANKSNIEWLTVDHLSGPMKRAIHLKENNRLRQFIAKKLTNYLRPSLRPRAVAEYVAMLSGRLHPSLYETWFWRKTQHKQALKYAVESECDFFLANDWEALPVAAEAGMMNHAKLIFDAHEYAPLELENRRVYLYCPVYIFFKTLHEVVSGFVSEHPFCLSYVEASSFRVHAPCPGDPYLCPGYYGLHRFGELSY